MKTITGVLVAMVAFVVVYSTYSIVNRPQYVGTWRLEGNQQMIFRSDHTLLTRFYSPNFQVSHWEPTSDGVHIGEDYYTMHLAHNNETLTMTSLHGKQLVLERVH